MTSHELENNAQGKPQPRTTADGSPEPSDDHPHAHRARNLGILAAVVLTVLAIFIVVRVRAAHQAQQQKAVAAAARNRGVPVAVAPVESRDVPVYLDGLGNVAALNTVTIKPRIDGQLLRFNFREGDEVLAGTELALIDPRPSEAALAQAEATRNRDEATLQNARLDLARFADLYKSGVISQQQYDTQRSAVRMNEGTVESDQAQIRQASLNVSYCHIQAPISGRMGIRFVDPGNMVHASDPNGLLVIAQTHPIAVLFTLPEDQVTAVMPHLKRGDSLAVEAWSRDSSQLIARGTLLTIDNQIDPNTGTFRCKAVFPNDDATLFPNQFVNARLLVDRRKDALTIPAAAVQHGPKGTFVYVAGPNGEAQERPVSVVMTEGLTAVVSGGVRAGERVITDGADKVQPNGKVAIAGARRGAAAGNANANGGSPAGGNAAGDKGQRRGHVR